MLNINIIESINIIDRIVLKHQIFLQNACFFFLLDAFRALIVLSPLNSSRKNGI